MVSTRYFKTRNEAEVIFEIDPSDAESAAVVAESHGWTPRQMKRTRRGRGPFRLKVRVPRNSAVQFRYLLDGARWENDEAADAYWPNPLGSDNSVVFID